MMKKIKQKYGLWFAVIFCIPWITEAQTVFLREMTVQHVNRNTKMILTFSAPVHYQIGRLSSPNRFLVDLSHVKTLYRLHFPVSADIPAFRYATHRNGVLRLVFAVDTSVKVSVLPNQNQLTVLFYPKKQKQIVVTRASYSENNKKYHDVIVVIDPGHGGKDPGATGLGGTREKNIVFEISKKLQRLINQQPGYRALLTRTGDYYLTLRERLRIARKDKADMFIAIHADKWKNARARGVSVFALSQRGATSEAARWLAARENASELMGGVDLNDKSHLLKSVLINLSQSATIRASLKIGSDIIHAVQPIAHLHHDCVEQAAFVVLKSPDIPSLLIETGFLSNPNEEQRLKNPLYQQQLANALMLGIRDYFSHYPPRNTWEHARMSSRT